MADVRLMMKDGGGAGRKRRYFFLGGAGGGGGAGGNSQKACSTTRQRRSALSCLIWTFSSMISATFFSQSWIASWRARTMVGARAKPRTLLKSASITLEQE